MKPLHIILIIIFILFLSCKKDKNSDNSIGSINISNANSLLIGTVKTGIFLKDDPSDSIILFKQDTLEEIHPVIFYNKDGGDLGDTYVPDGIYTINTSFFLFNVYLKGDASQKIQSYIVNKTDGNANRLKEAVIPMVYSDNNWKKGFSSGGFINGERNTYYIPDGQKIIRLRLNADGTGETTSLLLNDPLYDIDTVGNVICGNVAELANKTKITISEINDKSWIVKNYKSGFYLIKQIADTLNIQTITFGEKDYNLNNAYKIIKNSSNWRYLGHTSILNKKASLIIFDKAIIFIDSAEAKLVSFSALSLQTISSFCISDDALFITGLNNLNIDVFLKINPKPDPLTFSHIFAPGTYKIQFLQMSPEGGYSFYANKINSVKDVIGFCSSAHKISILDNDYNIYVKQVLPLK